MKAMTIIFCFLISLSQLYAQADRAGSIVQLINGIVIVKNENPDAPFLMGEKLRLLTGDKTVLLEVIFPMQSSAKCKIVSGNYKALKVGNIVYSGGMPKKSDRESINTASPVKDNSVKSDIIFKTRTTTNHRYYRTRLLTWDEAEKEAISKNGHLVTINDKSEEDWIRENFGKDMFYWIGLIKENGEMHWTSGEKVEYLNISGRAASGEVVLMNVSGFTLYGETTGDSWNFASRLRTFHGIVEIGN